MVRLLHAARTDVGMIRSGNEDNYSVKAPAGASRGLFIVADGMGGHAAGEVASEMAVQTIERELDTLKELNEALGAERLTEALRKANRTIHDRTIAEVVSSRTGATACRVTRASGAVVVVPLQATSLQSKPNRRLQATRMKPRAPEPGR